MLDTAVRQARDCEIDTLMSHPAIWKLFLALSPPICSLSLKCDYVFTGDRPHPGWAKNQTMRLSMTELHMYAQYGHHICHIYPGLAWSA